MLTNNLRLNMIRTVKFKTYWKQTGRTKESFKKINGGDHNSYSWFYLFILREIYIVLSKLLESILLIQECLRISSVDYCQASIFLSKTTAGDLIKCESFVTAQICIKKLSEACYSSHPLLYILLVLGWARWFIDGDD